MKGTVRTFTVAGKNYNVWSDFIKRGTFAENENGEVKMIYGGGYIHTDLTVRKHIMLAFNTGTFRK